MKKHDWYGNGHFIIIFRTQAEKQKASGSHFILWPVPLQDLELHKATTSDPPRWDYNSDRAPYQTLLVDALLIFCSFKVCS